MPNLSEKALPPPFDRLSPEERDLLARIAYRAITDPWHHRHHDDYTDIETTLDHTTAAERSLIYSLLP